MICEQCQQELPEEEAFKHAGKTVCEDCYVDLVSVPKTCDPMAVRSARLTRELQGQTGEDGLLPIQKQIYSFLKEQGQATREEIAEQFELSPKELEKHFAVLRHCELARGFKEGQTVYLTTMN